MMRFLKARFIIPALALIAIIIVLLMFFVGALHVGAVEVQTIKFDYSDFTNVNDLTTLNKNYQVGSNSNFIMYFDEETTTITVVDKITNATYYTAIPSEFSQANGYTAEAISTGTYNAGELVKTDVKNSNWMSNFVLYYVDGNGNEVTTPINVIDNSVGFLNELIGEYERHYAINYNLVDENIIQVCYDIGKFTSLSAYFPTQVRISDWNERLRGNITLSQAVNASGEYYYTGVGKCYGDDILEFLEENGLAEQTGGNATTQEYNIAILDEDIYDSYGTWLNVNDGSSPLIYNPFISAKTWVNTIKAIYSVGSSDTLVDDEGKPIQYYTNKNINQQLAKELYKILYTSYSQTDESGHILYDPFGEEITRGGFPARDEDGNFLYDEEGKPVQQLYTIDLVEEQNGFFGVGGDSTLPVFRIALQFKLTDNGLETSIIHDSLLDSTNWSKGDDEMYNRKCKISRVEISPMLSTSFDLTEDNEGIIVLPDGSGSVIEFNNGAESRNASAYNHKIYGTDDTFLQNNLTAITPDLMFPMYGFLDVKAHKGIMAVVTSGATLTSIVADSARTATPYNYAKFISYLRETETVNLTYGWYRYDIVKWAENFIPTDIVYHYSFLRDADLDYSSLAQKYRAFLCDQYGIDPAGIDDTNDTVVNLNIVGAYRHYQLTLGIIYYKKSALTSFDEAEAMIQELLDEGLTNLSVSYKGWTQDALEYKLRRNFSISPALGGRKGMQDLSDFLAKNNIDFYPEFNVSTTKGYKYGFGNIKYTARGVGNIAAKEYEYDQSKLQYDKKSKPTYKISPKYYEELSANAQKSFAKTNANGVYLVDIGSEKIGDYRKSSPLYSEIGAKYQTNIINYWNSQNYKVQVNSPFDFAIANASNIVGAPLTATLDPIIDYTIPFYELVLSGLVDYSMEIINGSNDYSVEWYLAKAVETGSNLYFQIAYEDNSILLETDYTQYYRVHFNQWKGTIVDMTNRLNATGIHNGRLIKHETIAVKGLKIAKVEYSNGITLYVNTNSQAVTYNSVTINAYSWVTA